MNQIVKLDSEVMKMIKNLAEKYENARVSKKDLVESAKARCIVAMEKYDENRLVKLTTYLYPHAKKEMVRLVKELCPDPIEIAYELEGHIEDTDQYYEEIKLLTADLHRIISSVLPPKHYLAVKEMLGAENEEQAIRNIMQDLNVSMRYAELLLDDAFKTILKCKQADFIHELMKDIAALRNGDKVKYTICTPCEVEY